MEQIYTNGVSTEGNLLVLFVVSYKTVVKDDWLERTRARNRTAYQTPPQTFNRLFQNLLQPFLVRAKTSSFNT